MKFKKVEKEFLRAIVKYNSSVSSFAEVINNSRIFEKRGIAIINYENKDYIFHDRNKYDDESLTSVGYVCELISLIDYLIKERLITIVNINESTPIVIGRQQSKWISLNQISINNGAEIVEYSFNMLRWHSNKTKDGYWPYVDNDNRLKIHHYFNTVFTVSEELRDYVNNGYKTKEDIRYKWQQIATWVSIAVAIFIGLMGIFKEEIIALF